MHPIVQSVAYSGREAQPGLTQIEGIRVNWKQPPEDPTEGCPAGWRRTVFMASLEPYLRMRDNAGNRVPNRFFDECDDPLVWALVNYFEQQQELALAHRLSIEATYRPPPTDV